MKALIFRKPMDCTLNLGCGWASPWRGDPSQFGFPLFHRLQALIGNEKNQRRVQSHVAASTNACTTSKHSAWQFTDSVWSNSWVSIRRTDRVGTPPRLECRSSSSLGALVTLRVHTTRAAVLF